MTRRIRRASGNRAEFRRLEPVAGSEASRHARRTRPWFCPDQRSLWYGQAKGRFDRGATAPYEFRIFALLLAF